MSPRLSLGLLGCCVAGGWWCGVGAATPAPPPKEPDLKCVLRWTGRSNGQPARESGEVVVTNVSSEPIDIGTLYGPLGKVDVRITGPDGKTVKKPPLWSRWSEIPRGVKTSYLLNPRESYTEPVQVVGLEMKDCPPGVYKVRAVCPVGLEEKKTYESADLTFPWPLPENWPPPEKK